MNGSIKVLHVDDDRDLLNQARIFLDREGKLDVTTAQMPKKALEMLDKEDFDVVVSDYQMPEMDGLEFLESVRGEMDEDIPFIMFTGKGREEVAMKALNLGADRYLQKGGEARSQYSVLAQAIDQEVRHWQREEELKRIGRLIKKETVERDYEPPYGDLSELNEGGLIKNSISKESLKDVAEHFMQLLDSSSAIYEKEGDYALGIFSSGWCRYMDARSRDLCDTKDNLKALESGEWLCHESCWEASKECMERREPVDIECNGGINMYAVPIEVEGNIIGAINFGYGNPPEDEYELKELADKYDAELDELKRLSKEYEKRPEFIIEASKNRIKTSARLLGEIIKNRKAQLRVDHLNSLLKAIRNVNQVIVQGDDLMEIMKGSCESLVEARSYHEATISLLDDESSEISPIAQAGEHTFKSDWSITLDGEGKAPSCIKRATKSGGIEIIDTSNCGDCKFKSEKEYHMSVVVPMKRKEDLVGFLKVSFEEYIEIDEEEKALLQEVANDLGFARGKILAENMLKESEERFQKTFSLIPDMISIHDCDMNIVYSNWNGFGAVPEEKRVLNTKCYRTYRGRDDICPDCRAKKVLQTGESFQEEMELPEGKWVDLRMIPIPGQDGSVELFVEWVRDITERKKKEKALQEAKQNYEELFEKSADALFVMDSDTAEILNVNQKMCEMYGYSREEALELTIEDLSSGEPPYIQEEAEKRVQKTKEEGPQTFEWRAQKCDGTLFWVEVIYKQAEISGGSRILASVRDITERKEYEQKLKRKEIYMDHTPAYINVVDEEGEIKYHSYPSDEIAGLDSSKFMGKEAIEFVHPDDREKTLEMFSKVLENPSEKYRTELRGEFEDGWIWLEVRAVNHLDDAEINGIIIIAQDISERKEKEEKLKESERRFRKIFESSPDPTFLLDKNGLLKDMNEATEKHLEYNKDELIGMSLSDYPFLPEKEIQKVIEKFEKRKRGEDISPYEIELSTKSGDIIYAEIKARSFKKDGFEGDVVIARDITEKRKAEQKLRESKQRLDTLLSQTPAVIYTYEVTDGTPQTTYVSESVVDVLGHEPEYYTSDLQNFLDDIHPEDTQKLFEKEEKLLAEEGADSITVEYRFKDREGNYHWLRDEQKILVEEDGHREVIGTWWDITEQKEAEERQEFLHSILRHDVKNKIQLAKGYVQLIKEEDEDYSDETIKSIKNAEDIIDKVRTLQEMEKSEEIEELELNDLIENVKSEYGEQAKEKDIELEVQDLSCKVKGGPLLNTVFSNLIENSIKHARCDKIRIKDECEGDECVITIEDDGKGIPDDPKEKIYERGFKKGENAGSGLGMYLVKEIVENYGGSVEVKNSELGGARFEVRLRKA